MGLAVMEKLSPFYLRSATVRCLGEGAGFRVVRIRGL